MFYRAFKAAFLAITLTGCSSIAPDPLSGPRAASTTLNQSGTETATVIAEAEGLRRSGRRQQALALLETAALKAPSDGDVLAAYGKALLETGRIAQASEVLARAHHPERPDWRILSAQGVAADHLGDHEAARDLYRAALRLQPKDPGVLTNMGLSLALSRELDAAETALREAVRQPGADPRSRQSLSVVLTLRGKHEEAHSLAAVDLAPAEVASSLAVVRLIGTEGTPKGRARSTARRAIGVRSDTEEL